MPKSLLEPTRQNSSSEWEEPAKISTNQKSRWPMVTRFRVTAVSFLAVVFVMLVVYTGTKSHVRLSSASTLVSPGTICSLNHSKLKTTQSTGATSEKREGLKVKKERHPPHTRRRLPQCIIIGVRKGGTRALLRFLNIHPSIQTAGREIHFFDDDQNYSMGLDWYRKRMPFSFSDQITMEKSPAYFVNEKVPERVWKMNHSINLLLIVRDPVERAISDYAQLMYNKIDRNKPFNRFEHNAIDPLTGDVNVHYAAVRRSVYHRHMARWLNFFHLHQFLILSGEELVQDPLAVMRQVEDFLGLEHRVTYENFYFNETRGFYCLRDELKQKCLANSKGRPHPDVDPDVVQKLRTFFKPHNEKFFKLVGQRFDSWLRDTD